MKPGNGSSTARPGVYFGQVWETNRGSMNLHEVTRYACYYGWGRLPQLATYDLAILQAAAYTPQEIAWLDTQGTGALAYLSIGEAPSTEVDAPWVIRDPVTDAPLRNAQWGTLLVDCRYTAWQEHLLSSAIPELLAHGFAGLFLDTVDIQDHAPHTRPGVVELLARMRDAYPTTTIVVNRGFSILETVLAVADGVLFEAFSTHYDGRGYAAWEGADLAWTGATVVRLRQASDHIPVFALDYAPPEDQELRERAKRRAQAYGMASFVAPYHLDWLPEEPVENGQRPGGCRQG